MDCNFTTIKTCELKDSTFRSRILDFGDFDISDYTFSAVYKAGFDQIISEQELTAIGNILTVPLAAIEGASNRAKVEVWMYKPWGFKDCVIVFDVVISAKGCPSDSTVTDGVSVTFGGMKVPVVITQAIVNIYIDYESLTPEQKTELRFDWEDFTPENILELQQPATEAAALADIATAAANAATTAANTATGAAITATENAIDATADAITATTNANNAADFAVQATAEAVTATGDAIAATAAADSATDTANAAAATANAARGWSPVLAIDSQTIPNKSLMKVADWTGGTGEKPTIGQNQWLKVGGGFTGDPMEAENIKGIQGEIAILEFEVNEEMDLIQYTEGQELDFAISPDGDLTLTF